MVEPVSPISSKTAKMKITMKTTILLGALATGMFVIGVAGTRWLPACFPAFCLHTQAYIGPPAPDIYYKMNDIGE